MNLGVETATAGAKSGTVTLNYQTAGTVSGVSNGLGTASAGSQEITITGDVYRLAEGSATPDPVNFGNVHLNAAVSQSLTVFNTAVNDGFSGGEKKRLEILQMALLKPSVAFLDETDSGLDIDALRVVSEGINRLAAPDRATVLITHYQRLLDYVKPGFVHVLAGGRIVRSGGPDLALDLEKKGYEWITSPTVGVGS